MSLPGCSETSATSSEALVAEGGGGGHGIVADAPPHRCAAHRDQRGLRGLGKRERGGEGCECVEGGSEGGEGGTGSESARAGPSGWIPVEEGRELSWVAGVGRREGA